MFNEQYNIRANVTAHKSLFIFNNDASKNYKAKAQQLAIKVIVLVYYRLLHAVDIAIHSSK